MLRLSRAPVCLFLLLTICSLALSSCSGRFPPPKPLPDLHIPGVTQIPGVTTLHPGVGRGVINGLTIAPSLDPSGAPRAVIALDDELYSIGFDGNMPQRIFTNCVNRYSVGAILLATADGQWLFCSGHIFTIDPLTRTGIGDAEHEIKLQTDTGAPVVNTFNHVTVSPDGHYLALVTNEFADCAIAFYAVALTHDALTLLGVLPFPASLVASRLDQCKLSAPSWSPDAPGGPWLAFAHCNVTCLIEALPLQPYLSRLAAPASKPITLSPDSLHLTTIANVDGVISPSWTIASNGLRLNSLTNYRALSIWQASLSGGTPRELLTLPDGVPGSISALAATPNDQSLVFAHTYIRPSLCPECQDGETPSHLYFFTPAP